MDFITDKIKKLCEELKKHAIIEKFPITDIYYCETEYKTSNDLPQRGEMRPFDVNLNLSGKDKHLWFNLRVKTPKATERDSEVYLSVKTGREGTWDATNPQCIVYVDGKIAQGLDTNHTDMLLEFDREYDIYVYFYLGMLTCDVRFIPSVYVKDVKIEKLWYDLKIPLDAANCQSPESDEHIKIIRGLDVCVSGLDMCKPKSKRFYDSVDETIERLEKDFYNGVCKEDERVVNCIGHTHIDIAWKWTLKQTREKAQRSFSTVLALMDKYPEYKFISSQPHLYQNIKEDAPELYERVKKAVADGRFEVEGAMWCEPDCNLISGESFVRQLMHGKRFMKEEFDVESHILWLPDVFGYSAALPQILKKAGVDRFITHKISANETNMLPYDTFMWEGIDGTEIFANFLTVQPYDYRKPEIVNKTTYNGMLKADQIKGTWNRYQQKEYNNLTLHTFGYGDGGGGPTAEMLETQRRTARSIPGIPRTEIGFVSDYFDKVEKNFEKSANELKVKPKWTGELYFEAHRGTYTSVAKNKKNNRTSELLFGKAESIGAFDSILCGTPYDRKAYYDGWREIIINQFHDIIPGSSIHEVYEQCDIDYKKILEKGNALFDGSLANLAKNVKTDGGLLFYNANGFPVSDVIEKDGKTVYVENIPAFGYAVAKPKDTCGVVATADTIESKNYIIKLDSDGNIVSLYDKMLDTELAAGKVNELKFYEDIPRHHDAWEISSYYKAKSYNAETVSVTPVNVGAGAGVRIEKKFYDSTIVQTILVYDDVRRIDVKTEIDWKEAHILLKALFPFNVHANKATYDIQFGNVERTNNENTSWDTAKFEVCAHKWADISEDGYGVSILNDSKYGHSCVGNVMTLSLLRCPTDPDPYADKHKHSFTYSIYPHAGSFKTGGTVREAYKLNQKLSFMEVPENNGYLPESKSMISCDAENIVVETVKMAEDEDALIVRMYDAFDRKSKPEISFGFDVERAYLADLMENTEKEIEVKDNKVKLEVKNYEIVTLKLKLK